MCVDECNMSSVRPICTVHDPIMQLVAANDHCLRDAFLFLYPQLMLRLAQARSEHQFEMVHQFNVCADSMSCQSGAYLTA